MTVDELTQWLDAYGIPDGEYAIEEGGAARDLADALMGNFDIHPVNQTEAAKLEAAYIEGYNAAVEAMRRELGRMAIPETDAE